MVRRHLDDLERSGESDFPYYFCEKTAELYCDFFPALFCHSKGRFAGEPFKLSPWQKFIVWCLFGWKRENGKRRFRKLFKTVARKNGKSTFAAAIELLMAKLDGEKGAEVYIGATKLDQAKIIHEEAERMLRKSPQMMRLATIHKNNIAFLSDNSFARPLGSDKPFDGLNPHCVLFDEMHAWKEHHRGFYDTLTTGSASRDQPLQVTISTKGDDKSLIFNEDLEYARNVVMGEIKDESLLVAIFELDDDDDMFDEANWIKSNPNLGVSVSIEYLQEQIREAKHKATGEKKFERYHANRTVTSVDSPIVAEVWDSLTVDQLSDWRDAESIGMGVDLGGRDDLAAYAIVFKYQHSSRFAPVKDGQCVKCKRTTQSEECQDCETPVWRYEAISSAFIASQTRRDLTQEPFASWIHEGKLTVSEFVLSDLQESLINDAQSYGVEHICFDPYQAAKLAEDLEREGMKPVKMPQNYSQFTETIEEFLSALSEGRFASLRSDEVLRWSALNMALKSNAIGVMCDKGSSKQKIDPIVAMMMGIRASSLGRRRIKPSNLFLS
jgi:phage terminase large subunit-like protein